MYKNILLFVCILLILMTVFSGCQISSPYSTSIYVNNETNNEYLIYVDSFSDTIIVSVKGNERDFLIKKFPGEMETWDYVIFDKFNIYIYNIVDSTYVHFTYDQEQHRLENYTTFDVKAFVKQSHTEKRIRPFKNFVEHEWKYTINDSLVKLMVKNTPLTNRVFKLKK